MNERYNNKSDNFFSGRDKMARSALECADQSALLFQPTLSAGEHRNGVAMLRSATGCCTPEPLAE
jgi:hypothetical protein